MTTLPPIIAPSRPKVDYTAFLLERLRDMDSSSNNANEFVRTAHTDHEGERT